MTDSSAASPSPFLTPTRTPTPVVVAGIVAVVAVVLFGLVVATSSGWTALDQGLSTALNRLHTGAIGALTSAVYTVVSPAEAIVITVVAAALIWIVSRNVRVAATFAVVVGVTWVPSAVVKAIVDRPRPDVTQLAHPFASQPTDASYPSGHMVFLVAIVIAVILMSRGRSFRPVLVTLGILLIAAVALSLVIDGVHFPSDVIASIVWSVGVAPLVHLLWTRVVLPRTYRHRVALERTMA